MHHCQLDEGQSGRCRARRNTGGSITCSNYGKITSLALDPVEKKPLARYFPGSVILSAGSFGCNLACPFCQNSAISMAGEEDVSAEYLAPGDLADRARDLRIRGNIGAAFTYNEPLISWEYVRDCAIILHQYGLKAVAVTNGSVTPETGTEILPYLDALNIDLKGFTPAYYHKLGGDLETVQAFIMQAVAARCHVELTTLIVPGENDSPAEMARLAEWIASANPDIPLHVSRFFPSWKMFSMGPTPVHTVYVLAEVARKYLKYVYTGNC
jgi:pyruvate formate lyase activating enzyme